MNPPTAGYYTWSAPGHDTDKQKKSMSRQITWMYYSMANQGMFSHLDSSIQRLPNGNTLICDSTEGHIFEVTHQRRSRMGIHQPGDGGRNHHLQAR